MITDNIFKLRPSDFVSADEFKAAVNRDFDKDNSDWFMCDQAVRCIFPGQVITRALDVGEIAWNTPAGWEVRD